MTGLEFIWALLSIVACLACGFLVYLVMEDVDPQSRRNIKRSHDEWRHR